MSKKSWLRSLGNLFQRKKQSIQVQKGRSGTFRPILELLEDRTLLAAGALDPTFGSGGKVITDGPGYEDELRAVAIQPADSKIVVAGTSSDAWNISYISLARYNADGSLDA